MTQSPTATAYALLDSGSGRKLERFGSAVVSRPAPAALWRPSRPGEVWSNADLTYDRDTGWRGDAPARWCVSFGPAVLAPKPGAGGGIGVFPEHARICDSIEKLLAGDDSIQGGAVLNLFAHTGLATLRLAALDSIGEVVHVDASRAAIRQARENAGLSGLSDKRIRWIDDDALSFMHRELRRNRRYTLVVADPPAYGRSKKGAVWRLEQDLPALAKMACELLNENGILCLTAHSEGWTAAQAAESALSLTPDLRIVSTIDVALAPETGGRELPAGFALFARRC
ncbi:MAG: class I SAM-dependent methyltransferase [Planctomycetes bacterium]|nr:class I SAM-dependent methyltransferase [Planctomycetota bacterium]